MEYDDRTGCKMGNFGSWIPNKNIESNDKDHVISWNTTTRCNPIIHSFVAVRMKYGESIEESKSKRSTQWLFSIYESNQLWFIFGRFSKLS